MAGNKCRSTLVEAIVGPLWGHISLLPALCVAHGVDPKESRKEPRKILIKSNCISSTKKCFLEGGLKTVGGIALKEVPG